MNISILGHTILIKTMNDDNGEYGWYKNECITINLKLCESVELVERTLLHEMIHVLLDRSGWSNILGEDKEEGLVRLLENTLTQFLQGNNKFKKLVKQIEAER